MIKLLFHILHYRIALHSLLSLLVQNGSEKVKSFSGEINLLYFQFDRQIEIDFLCAVHGLNKLN